MKQYMVFIILVFLFSCSQNAVTEVKNTHGCILEFGEGELLTDRIYLAGKMCEISKDSVKLPYFEEDILLRNRLILVLSDFPEYYDNLDIPLFKSSYLASPSQKCLDANLNYNQRSNFLMPSRIVYNQDRSICFIYIFVQKNSVMGGVLFVQKKVNGEWKLLTSIIDNESVLSIR